MSQQGTYGSFKTNPILETQGITLDMGEAGKFKIARAGGANKNFIKRFQVATKPHRRAIQTETLEESVSNKILVDCYADHILLGWEGVTDEKGKKLTFTKENAKKVLNDLPWLFEEIRRASEDASNFREQLIKVDAGNSEPSSGSN